MIAAAVLVDRRRAAELAPDHHAKLLCPSPVGRDPAQGGQPLVEQRQILAQRAEIITVMIP